MAIKMEDNGAAASGGSALLRDAARHAAMCAPQDLTFLVIGSGLVAFGAMWATRALLIAHPYLLMVLAGLLCLILTLTNLQHGLLQHLPEGLQTFLREKTIFDFLHDDSDCTNFLRRWGRMLLLSTAARTPESIAAIVKDMDEELIDFVVRKNFLDILPRGVREVLVPAGASSCAEANTVNNNGFHKHTLNGKELNGPDARASPSSPDRTVDINSEHELCKFLIAKDVAKNGNVTEPPLNPALKALFADAIAEATAVVQCGILRGLEWVSYAAAAACAAAAALAALALGSTGAAGALRSAMCSVGGARVLGLLDRRRAAAPAAAIFGAGACVVLGAGMRWKLRGVRRTAEEKRQ